MPCVRSATTASAMAEAFALKRVAATRPGPVATAMFALPLLWLLLMFGIALPPALRLAIGNWATVPPVLLAAVYAARLARLAHLDSRQRRGWALVALALLCDGFGFAAFGWYEAVLKVAFVGLALERVVGLAARADAAFAQSLVDLACEREAATRPVPPAMWPIAARFPPPGLAAKLLGYLEHPSPDHRAAAAAALAALVATDPRVRPFLADRAAREPVPAIRQTLSRAVEA